MATSDEKKVKDIASMRESKQKEIEMQAKQKTFSVDSFSLNDEPKKRIINLLIKSDVQGSSEAINSTLRNIKNDDANKFRFSKKLKNENNKVSIIDNKGNIRTLKKNKKSFIANKIAEVILGKLLVDDRNFN